MVRVVRGMVDWCYWDLPRWCGIGCVLSRVGVGQGVGSGLRLVTRKIPQRFRPKTAESRIESGAGSAFTLGGGEERRPGLTGDEAARCCGVVGCPEDGRVRDAAPTQDWTKSPGWLLTAGVWFDPVPSASLGQVLPSPLGEGEERRSGLTGDDAARCNGAVGCPEDGRVRDAAPVRQAQGRLYARLDEEPGVAAEVGGVVRHGPPRTLGRLTTNGWWPTA